MQYFHKPFYAKTGNVVWVLTKHSLSCNFCLERAELVINNLPDDFIDLHGSTLKPSTHSSEKLTRLIAIYVRDRRRDSIGCLISCWRATQTTDSELYGPGSSVDTRTVFWIPCTYCTVYPVDFMAYKAVRTWE
jgi:hypothetical protein